MKSPRTPRTRTLVTAASLLTLAMIGGFYCWSIGLRETLTFVGSIPLLIGAVTAGQLIKRQEGCRSGLPVYQAVTIYEGTLVFINSSGYAVGIVASGANPFAGVAIKEADNSAGQDGDVDCEVWTDGVFELEGSGFSQATVGADIYASDNYTVVTSSSSTSYVGKCVGYVSATKILVQIRRYAPTSPLADDATGTTGATFEVDSDLGKPRAALGSQTGGTGDFKAVVRPPSTITADRVFTLDGDADATIANVATAQTLTNKTLTSPVINTPTVKDLTEVVSATNVIAAAETGSLFFLNSATEFVSTLPAPAAGLKLSFVVTAAPSGADYTIVTNGSANIIKGQVYTTDVNSATDPDFEVSGGDTISFVSAKAVAGDRVDLVCDGTNWFAYCFCSVFDAITITTAS